MRVACVSIPHFYLRVEESRRSLEGPVVIGGAPFDPGLVLDCSHQAAARGVSPRMSLSEAYHLCPDAAFLPVMDGGYDGIWEEILDALVSCALRLESPEPGLAYLDVTRSARLYGGEEAVAAALVCAVEASSGLAARVGVGNSRFLAAQAAHAASPVLVVGRGTERQFLAPLPVGVLPIDEDALERLMLLGLTTLGRLAALPYRDLCSQFGATGRLMWEAASGADEAGRIPKRPGKMAVEREVVAEAPFETVGQMAWALEASLDEAASELRRIGRSCRRIEVVFSLRSGTCLECSLVMKSATDSKKAMLGRVMARVCSLVIESAVTGFHLSLSDLSRTGEQDMLFRSTGRLTQKLEAAKGYLSARYREPTLFRVEEGQRDARLPERRYVFREV